MYHPTTRLLTILELLQTHPYMSGDELANRLEVEPRSVRRYIMMLQELGIPVEGARGPGGGYRLRRGYKLPPLLFTEEEATAIVLGLLGTPWLEVEQSAVAIEGALAKVYRVLPDKGRERLQAISEHMIISPHQRDRRPNVELLMGLSEAVQLRRRVLIEYCSHHNERTQREVEPYGIAGWKGHWYMVGYCRLRQGVRLFRLDRIGCVEYCAEIFERPDDFDCQAYIVRSLGTIPAAWSIEVEFRAELYRVQHKIPSSHGELSALPDGGVLLRTHHVHLPMFARYLIGLDLPFVVHQPPELRDALRQLAEQITHIASIDPTPF